MLSVLPDLKGLETEKKHTKRRMPRMRQNGKQPTYVDIPNDIVDAMKRMDPREVANILFSKEM